MFAAVDDEEQFLSNLFSFKAILSLKEEVPTHTEDGIPIRKLFVSNLPNNTTRYELMEIFRQYGWIKNCWLRMDDKRLNGPPTAIYAFITFSNPEDAHNALKAPNHQKILRGRFLKTKPADSWHQPNGNTSKNNVNGPQASTSSQVIEAEASSSLAFQPEENSDVEYNLMEWLNRDCIIQILSYIPLPEIIKIQRVCKSWKFVIQDHISGIRSLKTSDCDTQERRLTTAMLRCVLFNIGSQLTTLHLDQDSFMLNDRAVQAIGKYCPNVLDLRLFGILGTSFSALFFGCKKLKSLYFDTCPLLSDRSLMTISRCALPLEELKISSSPDISGLFLTYLHELKLKNLTLKNCFQMQPCYVLANVRCLRNLTTLKLDEINAIMWPTLSQILCRIPKLESLSLSHYSRITKEGYEESFFEFLDLLSRLKHLRLARNHYITNAILEYIAKTCPLLQSLDISACNSEFDCPDDTGIKQILLSCKELSRLNLSYLKKMINKTLSAVSNLPLLKELLLRGNSEITNKPFQNIFNKCPCLELLDVCGCEGINNDIIEPAVAALARNPRKLKLLVSNTGASDYVGPMNHELLKVDAKNNTCNSMYMADSQVPVIYPDFHDDSDDSLDFSDNDDEDDMIDYSDPEDFLSNSGDSVDFAFWLTE